MGPSVCQGGGVSSPSWPRWQRRSRRILAVVAALAAALISCGNETASAPEPTVESEPGSDPSEPGSHTERGRSATTGGPVEGEATTAAEADPSLPCDDLRVETRGPIESSAILEASGLAASHRHRGVVWTHNDSGDTVLFAVGPDGEDLGRSAVPAVDGFDIEGMALVDEVVYLADIGDNDTQRQSIRVYRFDEPAPGQDVDGPIDVIELRYPDRARDAEAFLVDPTTGELVIIEKSFRLGGAGLLSPAPAGVFAASPPFGEGAVELRQVGTVALDALTERATGAAPADALPALIGLGGLATGADITADGAVIAVRTYETVWLFTRAGGQSIADALGSVPCEAPTRPEAQGEAIAFVADGTSSFVTISEGPNPDVNLVSGRRG